MVDLCNVSRRRKEAKEKEKEKKERTSFSSRQLALSASLPLQWFVRSSFHDNTEHQMPVIRRVAVIEARRGAALRERRSSPAQPRNPQSSSWYLVSQTFLHRQYRDRGGTPNAHAHVQKHKKLSLFSV